MAQCFDLSGSALVISTDPVELCTGYVVQTAAEFQTQPTLADIFNMPIANDMTQAWMVGFSLPMIVYLSAWALGVVVNFINTK